MAWCFAMLCNEYFLVSELRWNLTKILQNAFHNTNRRHKQTFTSANYGLVEIRKAMGIFKATNLKAQLDNSNRLRTQNFRRV